MNPSDDFAAVSLNPAAFREHARLAYAHGLALLRDGENVLIEVKPAVRPITIRQRKFLKDIVFGQMSEQVLVEERGKRVRYVKSVWAELYRREWLGSRWELLKLPGQRTKRVKVRNSTEELGVRAYSEYTERVIADAQTEWGVVFHFTREEMELRAYNPRGKKQHAGS